MRLRLGLASAFIAAIFMMVAGALPAFAQNTDLRSLLDRLARLERDIRTLNVQLSRGGGAALPKGGAAANTRTTGGAVPSVAPSGHALARIEVRFGALEEEFDGARFTAGDDRRGTGKDTCGGSESHDSAGDEIRRPALKYHMKTRLDVSGEAKAVGGQCGEQLQQPVGDPVPRDAVELHQIQLQIQM